MKFIIYKFIKFITNARANAVVLICVTFLADEIYYV